VNEDKMKKQLSGLVDKLSNVVNKFEYKHTKHTDEQIVSMLIIHALSTVLGVSVGNNWNLMKINTKVGEVKTKGEMLKLLNTVIKDVSQTAEKMYDISTEKYRNA